MPAPHLRLDHVALPAHEAEATLRFYTDVLGLRLTDACSGDDWGGRAWMMMVFAAGDGRALALSVRDLDPDAEETGAGGAGADDVRHVAFAVATQDDLEDWRKRLRAHDIECRDEDHGAQQSIYFADPNGNVVEITAPPSQTAMPGSAMTGSALSGSARSGSPMQSDAMHGHSAAFDVVQRWIAQGRT